MGVRSFIALIAAAAACSTAPRPKEPLRGQDGVPVTGRARFDNHFQQARRLDELADGLEARVRALSEPLATALDLPRSAPTDDLAAALRKVFKRAARLGAGALPPRLREPIDVAARVSSDAAALRPELRDAAGKGRAMIAQNDALRATAAKTFARQGKVYAASVEREVVDTGRRLRDLVALLEAADAFTGTFQAQLLAAAALVN